MENLIYTLVQLAHNFGAVAVTGSPAAGWFLERRSVTVRGLALLAFAGWLLQGATGAGFALTSYGLKGAVPEVTGVALWALLIKIFSTLIGLAVTAILLKRGAGWRPKTRIRLWQTLLIAAASALTAAAALRWYL